MKYKFTRIVGMLSLSAATLFFFSGTLFATKHMVGVTNNRFNPANLNILVGDTVVWNCTQGTHNVNGMQSAYPNNPVSFGNNVASNWTYQFVFGTAGVYDYRCDPHFGLGMVGKVNVEANTGPFNLIIAFSEMDPHEGQMLSLRASDIASGEELARIVTQVRSDFQLTIPGAEMGHDYSIDFFSDHNGNGLYDAPPVDHAWHLEATNVSGNTTLNFSHNTNFKDIAWKYKLTLNFVGMTPHIGEFFAFYLRDLTLDTHVDTITVQVIPGASFSIISDAIIPGMSYTLDFFADHNGNKVYDAPPVDHAWRMDLNNFAGDTTVTFTHNTNFTNIMGTSSVMSKVLENGIKIIPNPISDQAVVNFSLVKEANVRLEIYNLAGEKMASQVLKSQIIGQYSLPISVGDLSAGTYFLRLIADRQIQVLRFVKN